MNEPRLMIRTDIEQALVEVESKCGADIANLLRAELARLGRQGDDLLYAAIRATDELRHIG